MAGGGTPVSVMDPRFREVGQGEAALKGAARSLVEALFDAVDAPARWMGLKTAENTAALIETLGLSKPAENQPQAVHDANAFGEALGLAGPLAAPKAPGAAKALVNAVLEGPRAGSRAGQIGAIRLGGAPDLYATHGVDPGSLYHYNSRPKGQAKWDKELSRTIELSNPSIAIRSNTLSNPFGPDLRLVPRQGAFDPATSASTLFNRDAYTPRANAFEGKIAAQDSRWRREQEVYGNEVPLGGSAKSRLLDRLFMDPKALHGTEKLKDAVVDDSIRAVFDGSVTRHLGHDVAIASSPAFRSFADYEKLASGAATLRNKEPYESYWFRALNDTKGAGAQYNDIFRKLHDKHDPANSSYSDKRLREVAVRFGMQPASLREDPYAARDWLITQLEKAGYTENSGRLASILEGPFSQAYTGRVKRLMREAPSEYGELKVHGTTPVTGENWAAAMFSSPQAQWSEAERALAQRFHRAGLKVVDNTFGMTEDAEKRLIDKIHGEMGPARKFPIGEPRNFPAAAAQSKLPRKPEMLPPQKPPTQDLSGIPTIFSQKSIMYMPEWDKKVMIYKNFYENGPGKHPPGAAKDMAEWDASGGTVPQGFPEWFLAQQSQAPAPAHPLTPHLQKATEGDINGFTGWLSTPEGQQFSKIYSNKSPTEEEKALIDIFNKFLAK